MNSDNDVAGDARHVAGRELLLDQSRRLREAKERLDGDIERYEASTTRGRAVDDARRRHTHQLVRKTRPIRKRFRSIRSDSRELYRRIKLGPRTSEGAKR